MITVEALCRQIVKATALLLALSVTEGIRISIPHLLHDPLKLAIIQKSELAYTVILRPNKRSGVKGLDSVSSAELTDSPREVLKLRLKVWPTLKPIPAFPFIVQENHLRSPPSVRVQPRISSFLNELITQKN